MDRDIDDLIFGSADTESSDRSIPPPEAAAPPGASAVKPRAKRPPVRAAFCALSFQSSQGSRPSRSRYCSS